ncbi:hypothetical protein XHV734_0361 [Xanthomonas hortorum pv. vitians]|nr:hypothetical protein XHV734_0361 [Xanthomonas hortorum pv. vitians]
MGPPPGNRPPRAHPDQRALGHGAADQLRRRSRRATVAAGAGGQVAGTVRPGRNSAHRRRPHPVDLAPALARWATVAGHTGSEELLGHDVSGSQEGDEGAVSQTSMARRSVDRGGNAQSKTARHLKPLSRRERGWGEGTGGALALLNCTWLRPYPHPPLRGTFSRREKGRAAHA